MFFHGGYVIPGELRRLKGLLEKSRAPGYDKFVGDLRRELGDVLGRSSVQTTADVDRLFNLGADIGTVWPEGLELFDAETTRYVQSKYGPTPKATAISFLYGFHGKTFDETLANLTEHTDFQPDVPTRLEERTAAPTQPGDDPDQATTPAADKSSDDPPDAQANATEAPEASGQKPA